MTKPFPPFERGTSLIEVLVVTFFIGLLLAVIQSTFISQVRTYTMQSQLTETMQSVRSSMQILREQIALAGYGVPTAPSPSTAPRLLAASATTLTFAANLPAAQTFLTEAANKTATTLSVVSSSGFQPTDAVYVTDGTNWYSGTVTGTAGNRLTVTPQVTFAFAAGAQVSRITTVTFTRSGDQLKRNNQVLARNVADLSFTYDATQLNAIRRIGVTLSAQTRGLHLDTKKPLVVTLSTEVTPKNLGL